MSLSRDEIITDALNNIDTRPSHVWIVTYTLAAYFPARDREATEVWYDEIKAQRRHDELMRRGDVVSVTTRMKEVMR